MTFVPMDSSINYWTDETSPKQLLSETQDTAKRAKTQEAHAVNTELSQKQLMSKTQDVDTAKKAKTQEAHVVNTDISNKDEKNVTMTMHSQHSFEKLWKTATADDDSIVVKIGPFTLGVDSFHFLKSTLTDEVIDSYLFLMTQGRNILYVNCVVASAIFGTLKYPYTPENLLLQQEKLQNYDMCLAVINQSGCHWCLVFIHHNEKQ